jgi:TRAP-type C4-dicarboxylate transport system permease small subunit
LGIVVYYAGTFVFVIILLFGAEIFSPNYFETVNDRLIDVICLPFGLLSCYLLYNYLKKTWQKEIPNTNKLIDEIGKPSEQVGS